MFQDNKVVHFGYWSEGASDGRHRKLALSIIKEAVRNTRERDVSSDELTQSLNYLEKQDTRSAPYKNFRKGLEITDPMERFLALVRAYRGMI